MTICAIAAPFLGLARKLWSKLAPLPALAPAMARNEKGASAWPCGAYDCQNLWH